MANTQPIMYVINEAFEVPQSKIELKKSDEYHGKIVAETVMQNAEERNRNGRYYPSNELIPQLTAPRTLELLRTKTLLAETGHPLDKSLNRQATIDAKLACARILQLWNEGNTIKARVVGTNNDLGRAFDMDLKEGVLPAWSLRALGTVQNTSRGAEVRNLKLITYDCVIYPSHPGAYTKPILLGESSNTALTESAGIITESSDIVVQEGVISPILTEDVIRFIQEESNNLKFVKDNFNFKYTDIKMNDKGTKVILTEDNGNSIIVPLETHIHNEFMHYAESQMKFMD